MSPSPPQPFLPPYLHAGLHVVFLSDLAYQRFLFFFVVGGGLFSFNFFIFLPVYLVSFNSGSILIAHLLSSQNPLPVAPPFQVSARFQPPPPKTSRKGSLMAG